MQQSRLGELKGEQVSCVDTGQRRPQPTGDTYFEGSVGPNHAWGLCDDLEPILI